MKRKLTIRTKLAATLAVPLAALASFAAFQVRDAYNRSDQVKLQAGLATSATGPAGALTALENERDYEALRAIGQQNLVAPKGTKFSAQVTAATDVALGRFRTLLLQVGGSAAGNYRATLGQVSGGLVSLRQLAEDEASRVSSPANAAQASRIFDRYSGLIGQLLDADQRSGATIDDSQLRTGAELLNSLARQSDTESGIGIKVGLAALTRDTASAASAQRLADLQAAGDADLRVRADGVFEHAILGALDAPDRQKAVAQLQVAAHDPLHSNLVALLKIRPASINLLRVAQTNTAQIVSSRASSLTGSAHNDERNWLAITVGSVLLAIALLWLTSRWITRPLRSLADQATDMAGKWLPAAVQEILETPVNETVVEPDVEPVHVRAGGEVHDVEVALNKVQDSAVSLAVEQATLRRSIADAYVNLGRRNQNLLSRQLEFITQLENDESDPETLEHLFRLDHLATRMRRNAESLLVLAGLAPPRTWSAPVAMGDVVRGALGEVEGYRRVHLRHIDDARVDGSAAADISHVIAELVENGLSFSPPDADVEVYGRRDEHGYVITVVDTGIGMHEEDLERANALLASASALTLAPSRFLGHYVVAQLAARHQLAVHLAASPAGGLTASIALPGVLLGMKDTPAPVVPDDAAALFEIPAAESERPPLALPKRAPAAEAPPIAFRDVTAVAATDYADHAAAEPLVADAPAVDEPVAEAVPQLPASPEPVEAPASWHQAPVVEPTPAVKPPVAPAPSLLFDEPAPTPTPAPAPAPAPPVAPTTRPRVGLGTFADLRGATTPAPAAPEPALALPSAASEPTPEPEPVAPVAPVSFAPTGPDRPAPVTPDRRVQFAEVAQAVDSATGRPTPEPASVFSEDLIPQRLPRRGRRASKLETPWVRQRPKVDPSVTMPAMPAVDRAPVAPPAAAAAPNGDRAEPDAGAVAHPESNGASNGTVTPETASPAPASAGGGERFAFFAAFRAAAEQAREEAGIDDRRGH